MAVYRVNKSRGYTVMANYHLRDKTLSLKAVGLLSKMLSFNDGWQFSTKGLSAICKEGPDAVLAALRELEDHGYLIRHRQRDAKGRMSNTVFEIYEQPQPVSPHRENPDVDNPDMENPHMENPHRENPAQLNTTALIGYIWYEAPEHEKNFTTLLELINASEAREDDETFKNPVDLMFDELEEREPDHFAVKQYRKYKLAAGKTAKSILISCGARLAPFDIAELRELMSYDEMELDCIGDRKTALFVIISDTDDTFNFVVAIMYSQLFNLLCDKADDVYNGRLPVHVRCLLDEFANIGQIPKFDKLIATIRSREISASIILQSQSQLKTIYKDAADTIVGNCDCTLFLGGKEKSTLKELSEILGKETIDLYNTSETRSTNNSYGLNYQKTGKQLMSEDEIAVMDGGKCILQLRGVRPFLSDKYDITKHPKYKMLSDYDKRNAFDIEKYRSHKLVVKPTQTFDLYDMGEVEAD